MNTISLSPKRTECNGLRCPVWSGPGGCVLFPASGKSVWGSASQATGHGGHLSRDHGHLLPRARFWSSAGMFCTTLYLQKKHLWFLHGHTDFLFDLHHINQINIIVMILIIIVNSWRYRLLIVSSQREILSYHEHFPALGDHYCCRAWSNVPFCFPSRPT